MHLREIWSLWNILWQSSALSNWKSVGWKRVEPSDIKKSICKDEVWNLQTFFKVLWRGVEAIKRLENDMHFIACIIFCSSNFPALSICLLSHFFSYSKKIISCLVDMWTEKNPLLMVFVSEDQTPLERLSCFRTIYYKEIDIISCSEIWEVRILSFLRLR